MRLLPRAALVTLALGALTQIWPVPASATARLSPTSDILQAVPVMGKAALALVPGMGPSLRGVPRGNGQPVLIVPGFMSSDMIMEPLERALGAAGYRTSQAGIYFNIGSMRQRVRQLIAVVEKEHRETGKPVIIVGHSLGGPLARVVAARRPDLVRAVIGLASPLNNRYLMKMKKTNSGVQSGLRGFSDLLLKDAPILVQKQPPGVPLYSVRAGQDGLVDSESCIVPGGSRRNFVVTSGHTAAPFQPKTISLLLRRLLPRASRSTPDTLGQVEDH